MDEHAGDTVHGKAIISTRSWRQTWVPKFPFYPKFTEPQWHSDIGINFTIEGQRQLIHVLLEFLECLFKPFQCWLYIFFFFKYLTWHSISQKGIYYKKNKICIKYISTTVKFGTDIHDPERIFPIFLYAVKWFLFFCKMSCHQWMRLPSFIEHVKVLACPVLWFITIYSPDVGRKCWVYVSANYRCVQIVSRSHNQFHTGRWIRWWLHYRVS